MRAVSKIADEYNNGIMLGGYTEDGDRIRNQNNYYSDSAANYLYQFRAFNNILNKLNRYSFEGYIGEYEESLNDLMKTTIQFISNHPELGKKKE